MVASATKRPAPRPAQPTPDMAEVKALAAQNAALQAQLDVTQAQIATLTQLIGAQQAAPAPPPPSFPNAPVEEKKEEDFFVTVLHGWPHTPPNKITWIDGTKFVGGVARDVPNSVAQHWLKGTRPDGKPVSGRVVVHVLPGDATAADYARKLNYTPISPSEMASMLDGVDVDALRQAMGQDRFDALAASLTRHVAKPVPNK